MNNLEESFRNIGLTNHFSNLAYILAQDGHRIPLIVLSWFVDIETIATYRFVCLRSANQLYLLAIDGSTSKSCFFSAIHAHRRQFGYILSQRH